MESFPARFALRSHQVVEAFNLCCTISCMATVDETRSAAQNDRSARRADSARRRELLRETDRYHAELIEEVGEPSPEEVAEAEAWCDRIERHLKKVPGA